MERAEPRAARSERCTSALKRGNRTLAGVEWIIIRLEG